MAFDRGQAERNLKNILARIDDVEDVLERDILEYRKRDTIVDEEDEYQTMRDIRVYTLKAYRALDQILYDLDRYE